MMPSALPVLLALAVLTLSSPAQSTPAPSTPMPASTPDATAPATSPEPGEPGAANKHFVQLRYPRDREYVVATVDGMPIWLEHLVQHIDERHYPGFRMLMAGPEGTGTPDGRRILESDLIAPWVRQLAEIRAFEAEAKTQGVADEKRLEERQSAALKFAFESYLKTYTESLAERGLPTELTQKRVNGLLTDYQMRHGLACELQGWIDFMTPLDQLPMPEGQDDQQLNDFFQSYPRYFGGGVTIAQILIQNRDAGTGILLAEEGRLRAAARLEEVQKRLLPDGSNFEDLARQYSDDTRGGQNGGVLKHVERFDHRLPPAICRAAWSMQDGQVSAVLETQYGWHLVKRIEVVQRMMMLYSEDTKPLVRQLRQRQQQENLLFGVREKHRIELRL